MHVTYLFDPLCGWCYGAGPALEWIAGLENVELELAPTGLFAGEGARPMNPHFAAFAWQNDQRIARLTGQALTEAYRQQVLGATGSMFDSAPATLALIAVGLNAPSRELAVLKALQRARYVDGRNICDLEPLAGILADAGFAAAVRIRSPDEELMAAYRARTQAARGTMARFGVNGVPALIVGEGDTSRLLPSGALFGGFEALAGQLKAA